MAEGDLSTSESNGNAQRKPGHVLWLLERKAEVSRGDLPDFSLLLPPKAERSSLFRDLTQGRLAVNDVSGQLIGPILNCLFLVEGTYRLSRNVSNYQSNIPENRRSHIQRV